MGIPRAGIFSVPDGFSGIGITPEAVFGSEYLFYLLYALPAGCPTDEFLLPWRFGLQPMLHASLLI